MATLRAARKRGSSTQRRSSTISRCISAICPAGPPKDRQPMRAKTAVTSRSVGPGRLVLPPDPGSAVQASLPRAKAPSPRDARTLGSCGATRKKGVLAVLPDEPTPRHWGGWGGAPGEILDGAIGAKISPSSGGAIPPRQSLPAFGEGGGEINILAKRRAGWGCHWAELKV